MRIGLDVRALNAMGPSATRGIGRYIMDVLDGLLTYSTNDQIVVLALAGRPLPGTLAERCEVVPVEGPLEYERHVPPGIFPWYMNVPALRAKARRSQTLQDYHGNALLAKQRKGFEKAVNNARLDVLHLPTVVDVNSYPEGDLKPPVVASFLDAIPLVYREMYYDTWDPFYQRGFDRRLALLKTYDRVVAISEASRQDAIRYAKVDPSRVEVVFPAVSSAYGTPLEAAPARARYGLDGPFVLFCSPPNPHKNPIRVIEAFASVRGSLPPGTRLAFISPLDEPDASRLREAARLSGLSDSDYAITGRIPEADVVALFQSAGCLVSPSLLEGFGLPAAQALAAGTPAIVADRGSQPEVVGDAGLAVDPESVPAIAGAIARLMGEPALRDELAARGREQAKLFTPEHQARRLRAIYDEVAR